MSYSISTVCLSRRTKATKVIRKQRTKHSYSQMEMYKLVHWENFLGTGQVQPEAGLEAG